MATCRLTNLTRPCGYEGSGVIELYLLDYEDFSGVVYEDNLGYQTCYVENVLRSGEFVRLSLRDNPANYTSAMQGRGYAHRLEAYIGKTSKDTLRWLHLATKRPQVVVYRTLDNKLFIFGTDGGAKASYSLQTEDGTGAVFTLAAASSLPLSEVAETAIGTNSQPFTYRPYFGGNYCQISGETFTGNLVAPYALRVSVVNGEPIDANGQPTSVSGRRQAALLLQGETLPAAYELTGTYSLGQLLNGQPTITYAPDICSDGGGVAWVLDTGAWNMQAYWLNNGIWNY